MSSISPLCSWICRGGRDHCIQSLPACIPPVMWVMVRLYTRPLDTSARPQPGVSVARVWTLTGGRGPETRCTVSNVWPGPGQCGLCCGAVVVMLSGQPGRPGRDQSSSLSPLSARPQTGGFVASGRPHRPKCARVHSGKTGGCEAVIHNAQCTSKRTRQS